MCFLSRFLHSWVSCCISLFYTRSMAKIIAAGIGSARMEELKRSVLQFRESTEESEVVLLG